MMLQRLFSLALMAALLVSLTGQGVARAGVPLQTAQVSVPAMSFMECMEEMAQSPADKQGSCSFADCIAAVMAGCSTVLVMPQPAASVPIPNAKALLAVAPVQILAGRSMPPALRPPAFLI